MEVVTVVHRPASEHPVVEVLTVIRGHHHHRPVEPADAVESLEQAAEVAICNRQISGVCRRGELRRVVPRGQGRVGVGKVDLVGVEEQEGGPRIGL